MASLVDERSSQRLNTDLCHQLPAELTHPDATKISPFESRKSNDSSCQQPTVFATKSSSAVKFSNAQKQKVSNDDRMLNFLPEVERAIDEETLNQAQQAMFHIMKKAECD